MFDRFAVLEVLNLLAHDYGLYAVKARLDSMRFRCAPSREFYDGLDEWQQDLYQRLIPRAERTQDWQPYLERRMQGWWYSPGLLDSMA